MSKIEDISILIAEDEEKLRVPMVEYLQLFFSNVFSAKDGEEAYQYYKNEHPDILIIDIHMPKLDGLTLAKKIRTEDPNVKLIIATAYSDREKLLQAIELQLYKYLIKPIQSDILKNHLFELVEDIRSKQATIPLQDGYYWEKRHRKLLHGKDEIELTPKEQKTLSLLISKANQTVSAIDIYNYLYEDQPERDYSTYAVTSMIKRLRQKLPNGMIKTVYGVGYLFLLK